MIVCHCHATSDRDIKAAVSNGAHTILEVGECTGAGTGCGSCLPVLQEIIESSGCRGGGCIDCLRHRDAR